MLKANTKQPATLLTHADVLAALHRCKYDLASAEASLTALKRRREEKYNIAYTRSLSDDLPKGTRTDAAAGGQAEATVVCIGYKKRTINGNETPGGLAVEKGGNRWEDWSDTDRAAFLKHLGDKVKESTASRMPLPMQGRVLSSFRRMS